MNLQESSKPENFIEFTHIEVFKITCDDNNMWNWLNSSETFINSTTWPYKVEFLNKEKKKDELFSTGTDTNHYGPFLNAAGVIGEIKNLEYRDLQYYYGSYVFSQWLVRPVRLEFRYDKEKKILTLSMKSYIAPFLKNFWSFVMKRMWKNFGKWMHNEVSNRT